MQEDRQRMSTFEVTIEETVSQTFAVEAASVDEALELARQRYRSGEYVLEPGELQDVRLSVVGTAGCVS